jgi:membrane protease YdiL (CAAX protease family)
MTTNAKKQLLGGLGDPPPTPMASARHLGRFLLITIGIAVGMLLQARGSSAAPIASRVPLYCALIAVELALVWFVTIGIHAKGYKLVDLLGRRWRRLFDAIIDIIVAIGTVALLRLSGPLLFHFLGRWSSNTGFLLPKSPSESFTWIVVSLSAGVCEELVYRGYLQRQLWNLTSSLSLALVLQAVIFGCGHIYQGWKPALVTAIYGLIFGLVAAWRRSVIPGAIAHAVVDVLGGLRT